MNLFIRSLFFGITIYMALISMSAIAQTKEAIYSSDAFQIYPDRVVQKTFKSKANSATHLISNYQAAQKSPLPSVIEYKFSINGNDNELPFGKNHMADIRSNDKVQVIGPVTFGRLPAKSPVSSDTMPYDKKVIFKVNMKDVLDQFDKNGYYIADDGSKIFKQDFKGVFIAGNIPPLTWDFDNLATHKNLELTDKDGDGIYEVTLTLNKRSDVVKLANEWTLSKDISAYPHLQSPYVMSDALYNLSLEEMLNAIEPDSTFRTGKEWAGVWTRDISYSIILSMACLQPRVAMVSLMKKVNSEKKIIQDTGTGGAYPVSTDRMIWATAAWEVYMVTGDTAWLRESYEIVKNSIEDDMVNAYDSKSGMVRGESSFLDWREQTYPRWMQPADIYQSECLGTNAVHYSANIVLAKMAQILGEKEVAAKHEELANRIREGMNKYLWMNNKNYYAQYMYGRNFEIISPRSEALGESLSVLWGIADAAMAKKIVASVPVTPYGITCIYPQIPGILPYHNDAVWPFVQSFWALASARAGNEKSVLKSIAAIYRPAALFLTNKENFVASSGDYAGTQINSSNMLWSLSGNISLVYKIIFGIEFHPDKISFHPFVPGSMKGPWSLKNFRYRNASFDIKVEGFGNEIRAFFMDGEKQTGNEIPASITGHHDIRIRLSDTFGPSAINEVSDQFSPATPVMKSRSLSWEKVSEATQYIILKNGIYLDTIPGTTYKIDTTKFGSYQVIAVGKNALQSFASEPRVFFDDKIFSVEAEDFNPVAKKNYNGFSGTGFSETSITDNPSLSFKTDIKYAGMYAIDFRYSNGNGPINTENKCAIRSLIVDAVFKSVIVLPQRGKDEWSNWGFTNSVKVELSKGRHEIKLVLGAHNQNMNGRINQAMVDKMRLIRLTP